MLEFANNHKRKIFFGVLVLLLAAGLGWGYQTYKTEAKTCAENGGKLIYDQKTYTIYCEYPPSKWWKW